MTSTRKRKTTTVADVGHKRFTNSVFNNVPLTEKSSEKFPLSIVLNQDVKHPIKIKSIDGIYILIDLITMDQS